MRTLPGAVLRHLAGQRPADQASKTVRLLEAFFEQLKRHSVPVDAAAIRAINRHYMAFDIYRWLAYHLHVLSGDRDVPWKALLDQFEGGVSRLDHFRTVFL